MQLHGEEKKIETKIVAYLSCTKIFPAIIVSTCLEGRNKIDNICYIFMFEQNRIKLQGETLYRYYLLFGDMICFLQTGTQLGFF